MPLCIMEVVHVRLEAVSKVLEVVLHVKVVNGVRCVLLCTLEAVEGRLCSRKVLEVLEVMDRVLLCMLEAVEGELSLLEVLEVMLCVLFCILEAVDGAL